MGSFTFFYSHFKFLRLKNFYIFLCLLFLEAASLASYRLPQVPDLSDQETIAKGFGFGTSMKSGLDPIPLGGYDGLLVSVAQETANLKSINQISGVSNQDPNFTHYTFLIGKGLYYDIDLFFHMTPPQNSDLVSYGALLRQKFYEHQSQYLFLGWQIYGGLTQFANLFGTTIVGVDVYAYTPLKNFTASIGVGRARGINHFVGGVNSLIGGTEDRKYDLMSSHFFIQGSYHFNNWILSVSTERYFDYSYQTRIAYLF